MAHDLIAESFDDLPVEGPRPHDDEVGHTHLHIPLNGLLYLGGIPSKERCTNLFIDRLSFNCIPGLSVHWAPLSRLHLLDSSIQRPPYQASVVRQE